MNASLQVDHGAVRVSWLVDHDEIELLLSTVQSAIRGLRFGPAAQAWVDARERLLAHLATEEAFFFPKLSRVNAGEARALAADHQLIRQRVEEIQGGLEAPRRKFAASSISALANTFRTHAAREDAILYGLVDGARVNARESFISLR